MCVFSPPRPCRLLCEVVAVLLVLADTCFAYRRGQAKEEGRGNDGEMRVPQDVRERDTEGTEGGKEGGREEIQQISRRK